MYADIDIFNCICIGKSFFVKYISQRVLFKSNSEPNISPNPNPTPNPNPNANSDVNNHSKSEFLVSSLFNSSIGLILFSISYSTNWLCSPEDELSQVSEKE